MIINESNSRLHFCDSFDEMYKAARFHIFIQRAVFSPWEGDLTDDNG